MLRQRNQRGSAMLEFVLAGIPLMFIWISIVQMAIGMWQYQTIQFAVKTAGAYAAVHGSDCSTGGNTCAVQVKDVAKVLKTFAIGIDPTTVTVKFMVLGTDHATVANTITCQLSGGGSPCDGNTNAWPCSVTGATCPVTDNTPGTDIQIQTEYLFRSALAMVAPGGGAPVQFGTFWIPGFTQQTIVF